MSYLTQKTIKIIYTLEVLPHSGLDVNINIKPAKPNFGIVFKELILNQIILFIQILIMFYTSLNTTVENEFGAKVSTIEHLMGALIGLVLIMH